MSVRVVESRPATAEEWDDAYESCTTAYYFQSRAWAERWAAHDARSAPAALLVRLAGGLTTVLPFTRERRAAGLVTVWRGAAGHTYGGWLAERPLSDAEARAISAVVLRHRFVRWIGNPLQPSLAAADGARLLDDGGHLLDLRAGVEALRRGARKGNRSASRQAAARGVHIRQAASLDDWRAYERVYADTVRRWGATAETRHPWSVFAALAEPATPDVRLWLAVSDGRPVAGGIFVYGPQTVAWWAGAALESAYALRPMNLLLDTVIADAVQRGHRWFDLLSCGGHEGVHRFKRTFGATDVPLAVVECAPPGLALASRLSRLARRALRS